MASKVMMGVLRSDVRPGKLLANVLLAPIHARQSVSSENPENMERKENITYRGATCSAIMLNRKDPGPSHAKRPISRVSSVLQARGSGSRPAKTLKKTIYRAGDKLQKFKQFKEGGPEEPPGEPAENERRSKMPTLSDQCLFKQNPKRLKISKGDESSKIKVSDWPKEDACPGPSSSDMVLYSRLSRPVNAGETLNKKRMSGKTKQQLSPLKFKKSLEKRRGSDASRKKSKTLFKKAGKIILTNDINKNTIDRKRRKN